MCHIFAVTMYASSRAYPVLESAGLDRVCVVRFCQKLTGARYAHLSGAGLRSALLREVQVLGGRSGEPSRNDRTPHELDQGAREEWRKHRELPLRLPWMGNSNSASFAFQRNLKACIW